MNETLRALETAAMRKAKADKNALVRRGLATDTVYKSIMLLPKPNATVHIRGVCILCDIVCTTVCNACDIAYYCSRDHQIRDRRQHRLVCKQKKHDLDWNVVTMSYGWWRRSYSILFGPQPDIARRCMDAGMPMVQPHDRLYESPTHGIVWTLFEYAAKISNTFLLSNSLDEFTAAADWLRATAHSPHCVQYGAPVCGIFNLITTEYTFADQLIELLVYLINAEHYHAVVPRAYPYRVHAELPEHRASYTSACTFARHRRTLITREGLSVPLPPPLIGLVLDYDMVCSTPPHALMSLQQRLMATAGRSMPYGNEEETDPRELGLFPHIPVHPRPPPRRSFTNALVSYTSMD